MIIENKCKESFGTEIENFGSDWRIFNETTLADLIHIKAIDALRGLGENNEGTYLIIIINYCVKAFIQKELRKIELTGNINTDLANINLSKKEAEYFYGMIFYELLDKLDDKYESVEYCINEIIKYSSYHKKNITSNTKSYFSHIFNLAYCGMNLLTNEH